MREFNLIDGIASGLIPSAFNWLRIAIERKKGKEKRIYVRLGLNPELLLMLKESRSRLLSQCVFYGHQWQDYVIPDKLVCMRCGIESAR